MNSRSFSSHFKNVLLGLLKAPVLDLIRTIIAEHRCAYQGNKNIISQYEHGKATLKYIYSFMGSEASLVNFLKL